MSAAQVQRAIEAGWSPMCDDEAAVSWFTFARKEGTAPHRFIDVLAGERHVQISISPTGRSVRVYVDGNEA